MTVGFGRYADSQTYFLVADVLQPQQDDGSIEWRQTLDVVVEECMG